MSQQSMPEVSDRGSASRSVVATKAHDSAFIGMEGFSSEFIELLNKK